MVVLGFWLAGIAVGVPHRMWRKNFGTLVRAVAVCSGVFGGVMGSLVAKRLDRPVSRPAIKARYWPIP